MPLYRRIVDEAATIGVIESITLHGLGEPLLDPHIVGRVAYAKRVKPSLGVGIFTNGFLLTPRRFDELREAGIGYLVVSLNAVAQEQHERIMGVPGKFDLVCANIDYARANRGDVKLEVHAVANDDQFAIDDIHTFYRRWGHRVFGGIGQCVREGNWAGENRILKGFDPNSECGRALTQMYVMHDGRVSACCFDPTGKMVFGDLRTQTIREIYNSDAYLAFRVAHHEDRAAEYEICRGCTRI